MSSSDSDFNEGLAESETSSTTDDAENNVNDLADDLADDLHINAADDIENDEHFQGLYDDLYQDFEDLLGSEPFDLPSYDHIRSAMNVICPSVLNFNALLPEFGDSLDEHLSAAPLIQRRTTRRPFYFACEPATSTFSGKLFVGNVASGTTWEQMKEYFTDEGFRVRFVNILTKPGKHGCAIVKFHSPTIANLVLHDYQANQYRFLFRGLCLRISYCRNSKRKTSNNHTSTTSSSIDSERINLPITNVHYGTLITASTMNNINRNTNTTITSKNKNNEYGIIAHALLERGYNLSTRFFIDVKQKKIRIIVSSGSFYDSIIAVGVHNDWEFEWNFRDLKGHKISPVLVNDKDICFLMQVKQPPTILHKISYDILDDIDETRLPGNPLIGLANGWVFRLNDSNLSSYVSLFRTLRHYNLTLRQFSDHNIIDLIRVRATADNRVISLHFLSNDIWVRQNQEIVNKFRSERWPSYPFETKFELKKLISKHIITYHDLIVDDQLETILRQCSINTLTSCTEKILEQAPRWFSLTYDNDEEDYDEKESTINVQSISMDENSQYRSSTGASITVSNQDQIEFTTDQSKLTKLTQKHHLGIASRLFIFALAELLKKKQLRRISPSGMYITKQEARSPQTNSNLVRKIYITPSTIFYEGPYREEKCAVTRHFEEYQDRFLRVTFRDEDYRILRNYNDNMTHIYDRIKQILINGIAICDRKYEFLAFSSSQLREHSCWMFANMNDSIKADKIRQWMGDFHTVRPVAKLAARLGQSFSTSMKGIQIETSEFRTISDVKTWDENHRESLLTDGIGIIAPRFAKKLTEELYPSREIECPSAFQIRCGGFKGMVCIDINSTIPSGPISIYFRDSMHKFSANEFSIDVVRTSIHPSLAYLNRQIILLLSTLGISDEVFLSLQERMLQQLLELADEPKKACQTLRDLSEYGGNGYHAFLIEYMNKLNNRKDPFVRRMIVAIQAFLVKELRTKAKILVPNSWSLFGVIDETKTLQYGQVFIQIDNSSQQGGSVKILQGPVVVTRNPCFHPGDIRRLEAVDLPALHGLKNVIVFPMQGPRSHAAEMSGGDLDGDTFWICTEKELIFEQNRQPFTYIDQAVEAEKKAKAQSNTTYTINDVCDFFGEYIEADNLGLIANSHLAFADQLPQGAEAPVCLKLAQMHSIAVDFAKNGVCAPKLTREYRPAKYPHFMEKHDKSTYNSTTILGKLYDEIKNNKISLNSVDEKEEIAATSAFPYKFFHIDQYEKYQKDAESIKHDYDLEIKRIMRQYGIKHEVEFVSGYILKFISRQYSNETKLFDIRNEINHAYRVIRDKYLRLFWEEFFPSTDEENIPWTQKSKQLTWNNQINFVEFHLQKEIDDEIKRKASAWFHVTYDPWRKYMKQNGRTSKKPRNAQTKTQQYQGFFSFAWIVYPVLLKFFDEIQENQTNDSVGKKKRRRRRKKK